MKLFSRLTMDYLFAAALLSQAGLAQTTASEQTTWVDTATKGISASQLISAADLGLAPSDQAITVRVALKIQNQAALLNYITSIKRSHQC